jgi:hypothetical protein
MKFVMYVRFILFFLFSLVLIFIFGSLVSQKIYESQYTRSIDAVYKVVHLSEVSK